MKKKFNSTYKKKAVKKPIDKNRIYAWCLLVLFVFWTVGSVLGISSYFGQRKKGDVLVASAADSIPELVNLIDADSLTVDGFGDASSFDVAPATLSYEDEIPFISIDKGDAGACTSFMFSSLSSRFEIGKTYVLMFSLKSNAITSNSIFRKGSINTNGDFSQSAISYNGVFNVNGIGYSRFYTTFIYNGSGRMDYTFVINSNDVNVFELYYVQLYTNPNSVSFTEDCPSIKFMKTYDEGFTDGLNTSLETYQEGIFNNTLIDVSISGSGSYPAIIAESIPSNVIYESNKDYRYNGFYLGSIISYLRNDLGYTLTNYTSSTVDIKFYFDKDLYPSFFNFLLYSSYDVWDERGIYFSLNMNDGTQYILPIEQNEDITNPPYEFIANPDNIKDYVNNFVSFLNISVPFVYVDHDARIVDFSLQYTEGAKAGYDSGYSAALKNYDYELNQAYQKGKEYGMNVGEDYWYNKGVESANKYTFTALLSSVVDVPIRAFTSLFNFEILGINLANFFFALLTICIVLAIVKFII